MMSAPVLLVLAAFITAIVAAAGRCPIWVPVILLCVAALLKVL